MPYGVARPGGGGVHPGDGRAFRGWRLFQLRLEHVEHRQSPLQVCGGDATRAAAQQERTRQRVVLGEAGAHAREETNAPSGVNSRPPSASAPTSWCFISPSW